MGGKSGGGSSSQTQKLDPWLKKQIEGNLEDIRGLEYNPYQGVGISPLTGAMRQALGQSQQLGALGGGATQQALGSLGRVAGTQALNVGLNREFDPQQAAMMGLVEAQQTGLQDLDLAQFQNPYQQQVVDQTVSDLDRARQMAVIRGEDSAIGAGAFGGSRHGVADAETNRAFADRTAAAVGQLNQQGFNTALQAAQQQQGMDLQSQLANQAANLQAGQFNIGTDLQAQYANQNAALTQQGMDLQAQMANQAAALEAARIQMQAAQAQAGLGQGLVGMGQQAAQYGQDRRQAQEDWRYQQHMAPQQFERDRLAMMTSAIQGIPFMGTTTGTRPGGSSFGSAIGGGLSGAAMGSQFGGPWGAAIGGGLGLLGGLFG